MRNHTSRREKTMFGVFLFLFLSPDAYAQADSLLSSHRVLPRTPALKLDIPYLDYPYQLDARKTTGNFFNAYANPSMQQSLALTTDLYASAHFGLQRAVEPIGNKAVRTLTRVAAVLATDVILSYAPGGDGWLHEEYHRSLLTRHHTPSRNDMNTFPIGAETVSVSRVTDENLVRFKAQSPADFIRLPVAGIEGQYLLVERLQRHNFFYKQNQPHEIQYWLSVLNSILYVKTSSDPKQVDPLTDELNAHEPDVRTRDFTGLDFMAWAYDLFRPTESYADRGTHPLGNGINRYRKTTDLTAAELQYLRKQGNLQWLNVLSPMMVGIRRINLSPSLSGNIALQHWLTSFGNDIALKLFFRKESLIKDLNAVLTVHTYHNFSHYFPAVEAEVVDYALGSTNRRWLVSPRVLLGLQPSDQQFTTAKSEFVGLLGGRLDLRLHKNLFPYVDFALKSDGWVGGNEFLVSNFSCRVGLSCRFFD
ncbi:hypothetical protein [Spirosoma rhododendri]|uniref:DUF3570 domain-containing protein n=1 Tax=Spirosoma rhododendri TaxID=2728024 RepID=A0A7L5DSP2_9BACT|nr:hypothetical protein [Spirosoma rhododendri]QJD81499.1 hypothetical protein HH216_24310 [Spirosoma rhododendri]